LDSIMPPTASAATVTTRFSIWDLLECRNTSTHSTVEIWRDGVPRFGAHANQRVDKICQNFGQRGAPLHSGKAATVLAAEAPKRAAIARGPVIA
jgi:hypothetical protein